MAFIFADSWDFYTTASSTLFCADAATHWDSVVPASVTVNTTNTRFGSGVYPSTPVSPQPSIWTKASATNDAGHHIVIAFRSGLGASLSGNGFTITLFDGLTAQCSIVTDPFTGNILLKSGLGGGTTLATFAAGLANNIWYGLEFEVIINNTTGSFKVRLNGNTTDDFSATGLNTRGGTTNNYANKIGLGTTQNLGAGYNFDDFLWFSTTGAAPNTWVGDIRAQQLMPVSDASVGLSGGAAAQAYVTSASSGSVGNNTNQLVGSAISPAMTYAGQITNIGINWVTGYTGKYKLGVYDATTLALLGQTAEQTNASAGAISLPLLVAAPVAAGVKVYICIINDTNISAGTFSGGPGTTSRAAGAATYSGGFPASLSGGTISFTIATYLYATITQTVSNTGNVNQATEDGDTTFVYGSTAGLSDLYNIAQLGATPSSIVAVQTRMCSRKSDTGLRTARVQVKSGATTSNGTTVTMGTSYSYQGAKVDTVDPNTSAAWTAAAVNALSIGVQVVA